MLTTKFIVYSVSLYLDAKDYHSLVRLSYSHLDAWAKEGSQLYNMWFGDIIKPGNNPIKLLSTSFGTTYAHISLQHAKYWRPYFVNYVRNHTYSLDHKDLNESIKMMILGYTVIVTCDDLMALINHPIMLELIIKYVKSSRLIGWEYANNLTISELERLELLLRKYNCTCLADLLNC